MHARLSFVALALLLPAAAAAAPSDGETVSTAIEVSEAPLVYVTITGDPEEDGFLVESRDTYTVSAMAVLDGSDWFTGDVSVYVETTCTVDTAALLLSCTDLGSVSLALASDELDGVYIADFAKWVSDPLVSLTWLAIIETGDLSFAVKAGDQCLSKDDTVSQTETKAYSDPAGNIWLCDVPCTYTCFETVSGGRYIRYWKELVCNAPNVNRCRMEGAASPEMTLPETIY